MVDNRFSINFFSFCICFFAVISEFVLVQSTDHVTLRQLEASDFQTSEDLELIKKFETYQIPLVLKRVLKSDGDYIIPWLRQKTGEVHDYQLTIETMKRGVMVTDQQFGWIKEEVKRCAEILNLSQIPFVFIVGDREMYADIVNFHDPFLLLSSDLIEKSGLAELRFVIGRELGHLKCDHVFYHTLFDGGLDSINLVLGKWVQELVKAFLGKISDLILADWTLASEISADRAGLIACQDLGAANRALLNFKLSVDSTMIVISPTDYIRQAKVVQQKRRTLLDALPEAGQNSINRWEKSKQLKSTQPFLSARFKNLQEYAASGVYQQLLPVQLGNKGE